jgi:hypothetical protein
MRVGLPPLVIRSADRNRYPEAISLCDAGDMGSFEGLLAEALARVLATGIRASTTMVKLEPEES